MQRHKDSLIQRNNARVGTKKHNIRRHEDRIPYYKLNFKESEDIEYVYC